MDKYSAEIYFSKEKDDEGEDYEILERTVASSIYDLMDMVDFKYDIFDLVEENKEIVDLPSGKYFVYISGDVWFESDRDWESGVEEGNFEFSCDEIIIKHFSKDKN